MTNYPVLCSSCGAAAAYKIAAIWSDGLTSELKTYSLCCAECLKKSFAEAKRRQQECPLELGETLGVPQVFEREEKLMRRVDLESQ